MSMTMLVSNNRITERFERMGPDVRQALRKAVAPLAASIGSDARARAAAHIHFLGIKPGAYLASIKDGVSEKEARVVGYVRSGSPLAHLLEYGAHTPAHDILPKLATVLAFEGGAGTVFAKAVHSPGATIPPYPAIHPAFESAAGDIKDALTEAVKDAVGRS